MNIFREVIITRKYDYVVKLWLYQHIIIQEAIISSYGFRYQITNFYKNDDFESELKSRIKQNILEVILVI